MLLPSALPRLTNHNLSKCIWKQQKGFPYIAGPQFQVPFFRTPGSEGSQNTGITHTHQATGQKTGYNSMQYPNSIPFVVVFLLGGVALEITGGHYFPGISCSAEEAEVQDPEPRFSSCPFGDNNANQIEALDGDIGLFITSGSTCSIPYACWSFRRDDASVRCPCIITQQ